MQRICGKVHCYSKSSGNDADTSTEVTLDDKKKEEKVIKILDTEKLSELY